MTDTAMPETAKKGRLAKLLSENRLAQARIWSGVVLFIYLAWHMANHAFGLYSDELMHQAGRLLSKTVGFGPVAILLYGSFTVHIFLSLWRVYQRRSLRMTAKEWLQLIMGLLIPYFMISHIMSTNYAENAYDLNITYDFVLLSVFVFAPEYAYYNAIGLVAAWFHGCLGMHMWFQTMSWYSNHIRSWFLFAATLLPALSLTGYLAAGQRIIPKASDGEFMGNYYEKLNLTDDAVFGQLARDVGWVEFFFVMLVVALIAGRIVRYVLQIRSKTVTVEYVDGPSVRLPIGSSLLDMSKSGGVPHANVCGGKGRCSTCRVRLLNAGPDITPPDEAEQKVLQRVRATDDVRLACQFYPQTNLKVLRLLPSEVEQASSADYEPWSSGREKVVTVMFADIRDFTRTAESRLPFDVVYLINQFSKAMGKAVVKSDGRIDKFLGDGFMALFGVDGSPEESAANALKAAGKMIDALNRLNEELIGDLNEPLRMGIGIHTGSVILGNMGYGDARGLTAIGDAVNTASRLESATKEQKCILCVSAETVSLANMSAPDETKKRIAVRGKKDKLDIHALMDVEGLEQIKEKALA
ncbi:MAG: 2Fe-2S iron-sulfur cluster binding domain-containing protein [Rhizobiaceae bacterium]|nr:2Fe-2S iron-sulfur cluster-binding protein [Hyphomicrobiales bacterium]NRB29228.1 2Fe-2S iron-sulfur cluster binding domain-containing protein [Rhizobiaceae bacterium]